MEKSFIKDKLNVKFKYSIEIWMTIFFRIIIEKKLEYNIKEDILVFL